MQIPLQIVFEHVDHSDLIESNVRKAVGKLEHFYDRITSARVVIGKTLAQVRGSQRRGPCGDVRRRWQRVNDFDHSNDPR